MGDQASVDPLIPLASGDFADVFDLGNGRVLKAFRKMPLEVAPEADPTLVPRICFEAEKQA